MGRRERRGTGRRFRRAAGFAAGAVVFAALICGGCSVKEAISSVGGGVKEYGRAETMVIVTTEKKRYEDLYTDQIWDTQVDENGTTFDAALTSQVHQFLQELKIMSHAAGEQELALSSEEQGRAEKAAESYFAALGEETAAEWELSMEQVEALYGDYLLAEKLVNSLTEESSLEVSDSEAKVISVYQIELSDAAKAEAVQAQAAAEGADFASLAKESSEDPEIRKQVRRGEYGSAYEEQVFQLAAGGVSGVIEDNGKYYVVKCISDYDEAATRLHKEEMVRQRKNQAFVDAYQGYESEASLSGEESLWEGISMKESPAVQADFFAALKAGGEEAQEAE